MTNNAKKNGTLPALGKFLENAADSFGPKLF